MWEDILYWAGDWNETQGFWTAVQGVGTLLAAIAALVAIGIARSQLSALTDSNNLLAASNDAMTTSNVALTRPYVIVDFEFRPHLSRDGNTTGATIAVKIENVGRTPAKNVRLKVEPEFPLPDDPSNPNWRTAVAELNRAMNGETVIKSLTSVRPLAYYLDEAGDVMGTEETPGQTWTVRAAYEDAEGHQFEEETTLELSHWRLALITVDPLHRIAKNVEGVGYQIKNKKAS